MGKTILIGGAAGGGVAKTAVLISKIFTNQGYYIFNYRDYPSLIKGGHNFNVLKISDKPIYSHETTYDMIFALDQDAVDRHEKDLKDGGFVLGDKSLKCKNLIGIDLPEILNKIEADKKFGNDILIGALCKIFDLSLDATLEAAKEMFGKYFDVIEKTIREGYDLVEQKFELQKVKPDKKYFISGSEAIASGAIASGIDLYVAYPITPATPVLHLLASKQVEHGFLVIQPENEIAVISSALGASYSGAMTMVGTSGAGFALMAESVSMQGMSEIPMVIYMSQRTGPATGVPTYNSQGDLKFVLNAGHGEFPKIVVAPGDAKECFYRTVEAFYLANKYRVISIILGDKHVAESNFTFDDFEEPKVKPDRCITKPTEDYKSYLLTESGVSPRSVPGQSSIVRATSYEHDEYGHTTENEEMTAKMN
ncbi:MAG: 2-oxoacid:acceptor oxidoreductase family protein, partial [Candidatus Aenigmarchaeota archaeon]|nr:2-oxoacid:acceptor oxidoreductase family protein [Candidatus Aenigmarchaeota archaeon]